MRTFNETIISPTGNSFIPDNMPLLVISTMASPRIDEVVVCGVRPWLLKYNFYIMVVNLGKNLC